MVHFLNVVKIMMSLMETILNISKELEYMLQWLVKTIWEKKMKLSRTIC